MRRVLLGFIALSAILAQSRQVAITIDDLPRGGGEPQTGDLESVRRMTVRLLAPLRGIPVTAFVNGGRATALGAGGLQSILDLWREAGAILGNHTYSHPDLNSTPFDAYTEDIIRGEAAISKDLRAHPIHYFRHPFLHVGKDPETRRRLEEFLAERGYRIAPVTLDNSDWVFAAVYARTLADHNTDLAKRVKDAYVPYMDSIFAFFESRGREVAGHDFPQILLIHASQLNADAMPDLLGMMRRRGYQFVTLDQALQDEAYRMSDTYAGTGGFSWIHRWSKTKGMAPKGEADEPSWVAEEYRRGLKTPSGK